MAAGPSLLTFLQGCFAPRPRHQTWAVLLLTLLAGRYLSWRLSSSLNFATPLSSGFSLLLLAAEMSLLLEVFLQLWLSLRLCRPRAGKDRRDGAPAAESARLGVDVFVPSLNEPLPVVERCLRGCLAMDHPDKVVWLLDDGGRPAMERLAARLGCRYVARSRHQHAKAGNLNHALPLARQPLLAVFDADVVPLRGFLKSTVPLFADRQVGMVQTPQHYMNADPILRNLRLESWLMSDEEPFYRWILPSRARIGAATCVGTSFVVRRSALTRAGGFDTATATEDFSTGIRIAAGGHRVAYLSDKLSAGLAPLTAAALAQQRCRWASGNLRTLWTGANPLAIGGLSPLQRLGFLEVILHWFNGLPLLLLLLTPLLTVLLGVAPIRWQGAELLAMAVPWWLGQLLLSRWLSGHSRTAMLPELYRLAVVIPLGFTVIKTLMGRPQPFRVTPKALTRGEPPRPPLRLVVPPVLLLVAHIAAALALLGGRVAPCLLAAAPASQALLLLAILLSSVILVIAIRIGQERPNLAPVPWFRLRQPARLHWSAGQRRVWITALSEQGLELDITAATAAALPDAEELLELQLPAADRSVQSGAPPPWRLPCRVVVRARGPLRSRLGRHGRSPWRLGCRWESLAEEQKRQLDYLLYQRDGLWPVRRAAFEGLAIPVLLWQLLRPVAAEGWFRRSLIPQCAWSLPQPFRAAGR